MKAKAKGTAAETAVVKFLRGDQRRDPGAPLAYRMLKRWPDVERRALSGEKDRGDIAGIPNLCIEVKDAETWRISKWLQETREETVNAGAQLGMLVVKVKYKPVGRWEAWLPVTALSGIPNDCLPEAEDWTWVRMDLLLAAHLLERWGF